MRQAAMGGLRVHIVGGTDGNGGGDGPVVVLNHGFGAPGQDLVPLARVFDAPVGTRFVFPEAPLSLGPMYMGGRAWWPIDMTEIDRATRTRSFDVFTRALPPGIEEARAKVVAMLDEVERTLRPSKIVLGGFSQGAMVSLDVALHTDRPLAGLALLSTTYLGEEEWKPRMAARRDLPVLQSHGTYDPLLPFPLAERLRDDLRAAGLDVTWVPFRGEHGIGPEVVDAVGPFLRNVLA